MSDGHISSGKHYWEGHWLDPEAFAERWYEEHPEVLDPYIRARNYIDPDWAQKE